MKQFCNKILYILIFMSPLQTLSSIPFEAGISVSGGERQKNRFDEGLRKFRTSIRLFTLNSVSVAQEPYTYSYEAFFRFPDILGKGHTVGLSFGDKHLPEYRVKEIRTDGIINDLDWKFYSSYALINYTFMPDRHPFRLLRRWQFEIGGGFGPLINPEMAVKGYQSDLRWYEEWTSSQEAKYGMLYRFETALSRRFFRFLRFRAGIRYDYLYMGGFEGNVNNSRGTFFYTFNGGIMPLSYTSYNLMYILVNSPLPEDAFPVITDSILYKSASTEIFFSISAFTR